MISVIVVKWITFILSQQTIVAIPESRIAMNPYKRGKVFQFHCMIVRGKNIKIILHDNFQIANNPTFNKLGFSNQHYIKSEQNQNVILKRQYKF